MPDVVRHGLFLRPSLPGSDKCLHKRMPWPLKKISHSTKANGIQERQKIACKGDGNEKDMHDTGDDGAAFPDKHLCAQ
ncbi:MAG: hypothetical protein NT087_11875 [Deltaproteobacteria bacterium]|nr:hypothetical protein [Deltaproteobacteria bacterium]